MKNGFTGGLIIDYPNSKKKKKYFLFLTAGYSEDLYNEAKEVIMPGAIMEDDSDSEDSDGNVRKHKKIEEKIKTFGTNKNAITRKIHKMRKWHSENGQKKSKSWIMAKKDR